jgi:hypothetical protein
MLKVCNGSDSVFGRCPLHVRFPPDRDQIADVEAFRFRANRRHCVWSERGCQLRGPEDT